MVAYLIIAQWCRTASLNRVTSGSSIADQLQTTNWTNTDLLSILNMLSNKEYYKILAIKPPKWIFL